MKAKKRYLSLDVFRGAAVCLMILVNNPGSWGHIFAPLRHASWHGLTPTDLVFPFFLFAVGNAMAFVIPRAIEKGPRSFWTKVLWRSFMIFMIGLFLNWYPFVRWSGDSLSWIPWVTNETSGVRIFGVLQRIAVGYFLASVLVFYFSLRTVARIAGALLLLYWGIVYFGNPEDPYSLEGFIGNDIDKFILGIPHLYKGEGVPFDPEGLLSTIPVVAQVLFGYLIGTAITRQDQTRPHILTTKLFVRAVAFLIIGYCWSLTFPVNKKIWTSSFVLVTTGLATALIAYMIYFIEIKGQKGFATRFFEVFGKNPLFIFALSAFLPKTARLIPLGDGVTPWNFLYKKGFIHAPGPPEIGSFLFALSVILFMWLIAWWMDRKKIYIKV